jgi:transposase-like protein
MRNQRIVCKKCGCPDIVKAGKIIGNQRYQCKGCGCQFQPNRSKGRPESTKRLAILLYMCGLSMQISKIVKTDVHAVSRWIRAFAESLATSGFERLIFHILLRPTILGKKER